MVLSGPTGCTIRDLIWHNVGALIIRTGFWGFPIKIIVQRTPKPYSNY